MFVKNTPLRVVFSTISVFGNVVKHAGVSLTYSAGGQLVFTGRQNHLNWTFCKKNFPLGWSNQTGKIILTAGQFARCQSLYDTPYFLHGLSFLMYYSKHGIYARFTCNNSSCIPVTRLLHATKFYRPNRTLSNTWSMLTWLKRRIWNPNPNATMNRKQTAKNWAKVLKISVNMTT